MKIQYEQKFHSVGQGLFYSSYLQINKGNKANIIFDCGSNSTKCIEEKIKDYLAVGIKKIDLLIISHLHEDHVSGLDYLLNNITVDTVVIPYLIPYDRLLLQILNYGKKKAEWYINFLFNLIYT